MLLALENPLNDPESKLVRFLIYSDMAFTSIFAFEAVMKVIALGFISNGKKSYIKNGWNVVDLTVVSVSILSLAITDKTLKIVKIFRLLKILRPLRVISRNKGLKIAIQALLMSSLYPPSSTLYSGL